MRSKAQTRAAPQPPRERASRIRQRMRLIDACISALHIHGPSRTTVEKVVAIAGMAVLVGFREVIALKFSTGILLAVLASLFYAIYIMLSKVVLQKIEIVTFMFYNMLAASLFLLLLCGMEKSELVALPAKSWLCFLGLGVICQVTGWLTINYAIRFLNPAKVSITLLAQTVLAAFFAAMFLSERLEFKEIAGSVIVLAGIAVSFIKKPAAEIVS